MTKMMYNFSQHTGELLSVGEADKSPLDDGIVYLLPAFATDIAPPSTQQLEVTVFADGHWIVYPDWRAIDLYRTADGSVVHRVEIGDTPEMMLATDKPCPSKDHTWTEGRWEFDQIKEDTRLTATATAQCESLLALATKKIAPLQDAVDLKEATATEIVLLKQWKQYRVAINRIASQDGFPKEIIWPVFPNT